MRHTEEMALINEVALVLKQMKIRCYSDILRKVTKTIKIHRTKKNVKEVAQHTKQYPVE